MKHNFPFLRRMGLGALVALVFGAILFVLRNAGPLAPTRITVETVREGSLTPSIYGIGTVEARRSWMVGPTAAARVLSVKVDVGDTVHAGQLLAEMDPVDLDQRLKVLDAAVERGGSTQAAARAQVADATARRDLAAINVQRNQDLAAKNFISPGALESRQQEKTSADATLLAAQANLVGTGHDLIRQKAERTALAQQRNNMRLLAPADGIVTSRDAEAGSTVVAGQAVLRLMDPSSLWVKMRVDQGRSGALVVGLHGNIVLRSQPQHPLTGKVARVELLADSVTEERIAQVTLDSPANGTTPAASVGELAEVTLQLPPSPAAPLVPNASIQHQQGQTGIWRMDGGKPVFAVVRLGASNLQGQVQVLDGVKAGDSVVVYSQKALVPGARVQVVDALVKTSPATNTP